MFLTSIAAVLAISPALMQTHSPLTGATPDTVILSGGWQMTPQGSSCLLTHANTVGRQDLIVKATGRDAPLAVGLPLFNGATYSAPVQLTISAQLDTAQPVGRLTFKPVVAGGATLLTANWPADLLLPRLQTADRLNFFGPDQHLIRSVRLVGGAAAVASIQRCLGSTTSQPIAAPMEQPTNDRWIPLVRKGMCVISRLTRAGNDISFMAISNGLFIVYQVREGQRPVAAASFQASLSLMHLTSSGTIIADSDDDLVMLKPVQRSRGAMQGSIKASLIKKMENAHWDALSISSMVEESDLDDAVNLSGSRSALEAFEQCSAAISK